MPSVYATLAPLSRAFAGIGVVVFSTAFVTGDADAATITINTTDSNYLVCTYGSVSITSGGNIVASGGTNCTHSFTDGGGTPPPTDDGGGTPPPTDDGGGGSTPPPTDGSDYFGRGLWSPSAGVMVADQSDPNGEGTTTFVPGCLNFTSSAYGQSCRDRTSFSGLLDGQEVSFGLTQGQVISLRYRVQPGVPLASQTGSIKLSNHFGGNIGFTTTVSISTQPGNFNVSSGCVVTGSQQPGILTSSKRCNIDPAVSMYYFNIRVDQSCTTCKFIVNEDSNILY